MSGDTVERREETNYLKQNIPPPTNNALLADPNEVDWDRPGDPHNPRNGRPGDESCSSASVASSAIAPVVPQILKFNSNNAEIGALIVTIELLGTCVGPIIVGPMSEVIGRRIIYNCANIGFCAFTVGCALTPSLPGLVILRFLQGCSASCSLNNAGGTISDLVPIHRRGLAMSMYSAGFLLGPAVGPIAGSVLAASAGWRWVFWLLLILNGTMGIFCAFTYTETYAPVILERKVKTLR